jgi:cytochrome P450
MLNSDPPDHIRLGRLVNKAFTTRTVSRLRPRVEQITEELLDGMAGAVDLLEAFAFPLLIIDICELLGVPGEERAKIRAWSKPFIGMATPEEIQNRE